jgi:uncharacterized membrane protein YqaE (UPF0057 family)
MRSHEIPVAAQGLLHVLARYLPHCFSYLGGGRLQFVIHNLLCVNGYVPGTSHRRGDFK